MSDVTVFRESSLVGPADQLVAWANALDAAATIADVIVRTNTCPPAFRGAPQEATAAIALGAELGLSPIASLRSMYVLRGQIGMYVRAQVALAQAHGHRIWTVRESDDSVTVAGHRADDPEHVEEVTWTIQRARQAGFVRRGQRGEPSQYETQPRTMLWSRAAGDVARRIAADALSGIAEMDEPGDAPEASTGAPAQPRRVIQRAVHDVELPTDSGALRAELPEVGGRAQATPEPDRARPSGPPPPQEPSRSDDGPAETLPIEDPPDYADEPPEPLLTSAQRNKIQATFHELGVHTAEQRHAHESTWLTRTVDSTNDLTVTEASHVIDQLERWKARRDV